MSTPMVNRNRFSGIIEESPSDIGSGLAISSQSGVESVRSACEKLYKPKQQIIQKQYKSTNV